MSQVFGIGTDILSVARMRACMGSEAFMRRAFTGREVSLSAHQPDPGGYYAGVFAGKEAVFKCLGVEADCLRDWTDIEVIDAGAAPAVYLSGAPAAIVAKRGARGVLLSVSSEKDYVVAVAALVGEWRHEH